MVFIRDGPRLVRTSVNRTVKVGEEFSKKEEVGDSLGEREAVRSRAIEDTESPEDEDMGEMWEEITVEGEETHDWNTGEAGITEKNTELLADTAEAADEEVCNEVRARLDQAEYANKLEMVKIQPERRKDLKQKLNAEEKTMMKQISGRTGWPAGSLNNGVDSDSFTLVCEQVEESW